MALVTISEAARLAGVSRKTVQRYIATGKLSATVGGTGDAPLRQVEISELVRVFGELKGEVSHPVAGPAQGQSRTQSMDNVAPDAPSFEAEKAALEQVIEAQKGTIAVLERQVDELREEKRELRAQVVGLLEDRRGARPEPLAMAPAPAAKPAPNGWNWFYLGVVVAAGVAVATLVIAQHQ